MNDNNPYSAPQSNLTPESAGDEPVYAGFWIRAGAAIIDTLLLLMITWPVLTLVYGKEYWNANVAYFGTMDLLLNYLFPFIAIVLFWVYKSATPGKMLLGLKIISLKGNDKLTIGQSIGRYVGYILASIPLGLGFLWVAFDKRKQGWHDKLAKTIVVRK